uniref:TNF receptor-associated factor 2-like n=1 Tax=Myxine glutinosa TaxID=7769 RepID=UPI00358E9BD3
MPALVDFEFPTNPIVVPTEEPSCCTKFVRICDDSQPDGPSFSRQASYGQVRDPLPVGKEPDCKFQDNYLCGLCQGLLSKPVQNISCGHRFCKSCFEAKQKSSSQPLCPSCAKSSQEGEDASPPLDKFFPDKAIQRDIAAMQVMCPFDGCLWKGNFDTYKTSHGRMCPHAIVVCTICEENVPRAKIDTHVLVECKMEHRQPQKINNLQIEACNVGHHEVPATQLQNDNQQRIQMMEQRFLLLEQKYMGGRAEEANRQDEHPGFSQVQSLVAIENIVKVLNRDVDHVSAVMSAREEDLNEHDSLLRRMTEKLQKQERVIGRLQKQLEEVRVAPCDGTLLWKVSCFSTLLRDAKSGRKPHLDSPTFHTSHSGYRMCLRLYPNGDGEGRGTHLSIFFVIMKGEYDVILTWPFRQKVTLMLLNQAGGDHVIDAFRPDIASSSFQRPRGASNVASGCPTFCPLSTLSFGLLQEDVLFFKCFVDLTGL